MTRLAHQDPAEVVAYKRAGWWGDTTVGDAVAQWARDKPDDAAPSSPTAGAPRWSEYDARATALAEALVRTGLPAGSRVAVLLPDGIAVHVAFVAAERAGLTVVGLGHRAGDRELRHILGLTGASGIVTSQEHRGRAGRRPSWMRCGPTGSPSRNTSSSTDDGEVAAPDVDARAVRLGARAYGPDDLFLLNSTSGTTGMPKVVMHSQNRWMYFHQLAAAAGDDDRRRRVLRRAPGAVRVRAVDVARHARGARCDHRRASAFRRRRGAPHHRTRAGHRARVREHAVPDDAGVAARRVARPHVAAVHVHGRRGGARTSAPPASRTSPARRCSSSTARTRPARSATPRSSDDREHRLRPPGG